VQGELSLYSGHSIWALEPVTGTQLQLTTGQDDSWPSFSPSGDMLAFQRGSGKAATIWLVRADGSHQMPLVAGSEPAFSPNGRQIVLVRASGLFLTGVTPGSPVRRLTSHPGDSEPQWSSTGAIAFERIARRKVRYRGPTAIFRHGQLKLEVDNELELVRPPSTKVHELLGYELPEGLRVSTVPAELRPNWSPRGTRLAVSLCEGLPSGFSPHVATRPALTFSTRCGSETWTPTGRRVDLSGEGSARNTLETACPDRIEEVSWQPLRTGTVHVPTVPCKPLLKRRAVMEASPGEEVAGSRTCITIRHRRRCYKS